MAPVNMKGRDPLPPMWMETERCHLTWFQIIGYAVLAIQLMLLGAIFFMLFDTIFNWS